MAERMRRLRMGLAHSSPGASGDTARPNYMGPSGNGLVGADERGGNPAESRAFRLSAAPVRFQKAVPGSKEKRRGEAPIGAPARVMGRLFPSAEGTGFAVRRATGCGVPHQRLSALRPLGIGGTSPDGGRAPHPPERRSRALFYKMISLLT